MRHTPFLVLLAFLLGCSNSHGLDPRCAELECAASETCCLTCAGLTCVADDALCGCPDEDAGPGGCGGPTGIPCAPTEYCDATSCGAFGTCQPRPGGCDLVYDPVCGCDGNEYGNTCAAQSAGVVVDPDGVCGPRPACGTRGGTPCGPGEHCDLINCGRADEGGTCVPIPTTCTDIGMPVCGCDGTTYGNPCTAAAAGVSVANEGSCESASCDAEEVRIVSEACDQAGIHFDGNACRAWSGCCEGAGCGAGWASLEECNEAHRSCTRFCRGWLGPTCLADEFCDFASDGCDWADASGTCRPRPTECPEPGGVPVCGCDGTTYLNECSAHMSGTDAASSGSGCLVPG